MTESPGPTDERALPDWLNPLLEGMRGLRSEDLGGLAPPAGGAPRESAVLVLFGDGPEGPDLLLTERAHTMRSQPGQVSFPGGSLEPRETPVEGALREAQEETGLDPDGVDVLAVLPRLWLPPRDFAVTPVVGYWHHECHVQVTNPIEVHAVFRTPLQHLGDPAQRFTIRHPRGHVGPGWMIGPDRDVLLWGFTAAIVSRLLDLGGWARPWDRSEVRAAPGPLVEWERVARALGIDVPAGETFDPVAAGIVPGPLGEGDSAR